MSTAGRTQQARLQYDIDHYNNVSDGPGHARLTVHHAADERYSFVVVYPLASVDSTASITIPTAPGADIAIEVHELAQRTFTSTELDALSDELADVAHLAAYLASSGHAPRA